MIDDTSLVDIVVLRSPPFLLFFDSCGSGKNLAMSACLFFNCFLTHSYLVWSQALPFIYILSSLWTHMLDAGSLFRVCWVDMLSTMSHIYRRLCWCLMLILVVVSPKAWLCHSHNFGWVNSYVLSSLIAQPYVCCKYYALFPIYALLHVFGVLNDFGGVRMPCLCTLYSNAIDLIGAWTLGSSSISFKHSFALLHMFCVLHIYGGVRIPCLCTLYCNGNYMLCTNLGELPYII